MRIARFTTGDDPRYAIVEGDPGAEELVVLTGDPMYVPGKPTGERIPLGQEGLRLLAPVIPRSKAVCLGKNYVGHAQEILPRGPESEVPILFLKPNTAVIGPDDPIVMPAYSDDVQYEGELAVVIGRIARDVAAENAADYIYGYTCANDVTARDLQNREDQWFRAKAFDTSLPLGPWIETELAPDALEIRTLLNGKEMQSGNTSEMIRDVGSAVEMATEVMTLLPGDIILTGTPAGVAPMAHGDRVEVEIEGIGTLMNPVLRR
jgi:2-keto-4-pentenoate hydratase/2-oxohepta-3-ene-1,7-dioic acid hydratase in catechol pathway